VKNFGRSGRTKYTHLVDQDTTQFDSPWMADTAQNIKFYTAKGGGMKQAFDRPSTSKKKTTRWKCVWKTILIRNLLLKISRDYWQIVCVQGKRHMTR